jgi:hypothetical protein
VARRRRKGASGPPADPRTALAHKGVWLGCAHTLLCTDGLACYAKQALLIFREARRTGRVGRPRLMLPEGVMVARVKKRYERRRVVEVLREVVTGAEAAVQERLMATQRSLTALINTPPT